MKLLVFFLVIFDHFIKITNPIQAFALKFKLTQHITNVHEKGHFPCDECDAVLNSADYLRCHKIKHRHREKTLPCPVCGKMFAQQCDLNAHYNAAHLVEPSNCDVCDKKFDNRTKLKAHIRAVHSREEEGQLHEWECPICHKVLRSKKINQSRSQHLETHEEKKYKCEFCPKTFRLKISYDGHINEHKGIYEHKCQPCNKVAFSSQLFEV